MSSYVVVGGSSGIGLAIANQLASNANKIICLSRTKGGLEGLSHVDFTSYDVLSGQTASLPLPQSLNGLVYCPGSIVLKPFSRFTEQEMMEDYRLNVTSALRIFQHYYTALKASGQGSIVLFSTVAVQTGMPFHTMVAASKGAVEGMVRSLAAEMAPWVRVNAIAPGLTNTPLAHKLLNTPEKTDLSAKRHPLARIGTAEEVAALAVYLLSGQSSWMTGQILHLDGGIGVLKT